MHAPRLELTAQVHEEGGAGAVDRGHPGVVDLHTGLAGAIFEQRAQPLPKRGRLFDREWAPQLDANSFRQLGLVPSELRKQAREHAHSIAENLARFWRA